MMTSLKKKQKQKSKRKSWRRMIQGVATEIRLEENNKGTKCKQCSKTKTHERYEEQKKEQRWIYQVGKAKTKEITFSRAFFFLFLLCSSVLMLFDFFFLLIVTIISINFHLILFLNLRRRIVISMSPLDTISICLHLISICSSLKLLLQGRKQKTRTRRARRG